MVERLARGTREVPLQDLRVPPEAMLPPSARDGRRSAAALSRASENAAQ
jgi:hypothetical protein